MLSKTWPTAAFKNLAYSCLQNAAATTLSLTTSIPAAHKSCHPSVLLDKHVPK